MICEPQNIRRTTQNFKLCCSITNTYIRGMEGYVHITRRLLLPRSELEYSFTRSSGHGGQHVNKVSTRVEIRFNIPASARLTPSEKSRLVGALGGQLTPDGMLHVESQASRSQWKNREDAERKLAEILKEALLPPKPRVATKPSKSAKNRTLIKKKLHSAKKRLRVPPRDEWN